MTDSSLQAYRSRCEHPHDSKLIARRATAVRPARLNGSAGFLLLYLLIAAFVVSDVMQFQGLDAACVDNYCSHQD